MKTLRTVIDLGLSGLFILLCLTAVAFFKTNAAKIGMDEWLLAKRNTALPCSPNQSSGNQFIKTENNNEHEPVNNHQLPGGEGNGCPHQTAATGTCDINIYKRRSFKLSTC